MCNRYRNIILIVMVIRGFQALYKYKSNCVNLYSMVEQNPVIPNINYGANIINYIQ